MLRIESIRLELKIFLMSLGRYSRISARFWGSPYSRMISLRSMRLGCLSFLSSSISLSTRNDSYLFSRNLLIFLTATRFPVRMSIADMTCEDTPLPITSSNRYRYCSSLRVEVTYFYFYLASSCLAFFLSRGFMDLILYILMRFCFGRKVSYLGLGYL